MREAREVDFAALVIALQNKVNQMALDLSKLQAVVTSAQEALAGEVARTQAAVDAAVKAVEAENQAAVDAAVKAAEPVVAAPVDHPPA